MQAENSKLEDLPYASQNLEEIGFTCEQEQINRVNNYFWILFLKVYDLIANKY